MGRRGLGDRYVSGPKVGGDRWVGHSRSYRWVGGAQSCSYRWVGHRVVVTGGWGTES